MATAIGLGMQLTASAAGMAKGLSDADRQLQALGRQAENSAKLFDSFTGATAAAAAAQAGIATEYKLLATTFQAGLISAEEFKKGLQEIADSAQQQAAAFAEGARITDQVATAEERRTQTLDRLQSLLEQGAINQQTYDRAAAAASGANEQAAKAEADRAQALARAAQITQANLSPMQRYDAEVLELTQHLQAGRITQETFNAAVAKATAAFVRAESAARGYDSVVEDTSDAGVLKFNELAGIVAALPGPIGNVAGRLSGLSSAGEGLGRVFSGGISSGLQGVGASIAGLVNPLTIGIGGVVAFTAAGSTLAAGLVDLEDRVEKLGNTADKLGVSFEFVQTLDEAARRSGTSIESVSAAFGRLQKSVLGVDEESKAAQAALQQLGIAAQDLANKTPEQQYRLIGRRISDIEDPARRTAVAISLFGRSGADLLPFFRNIDSAAEDMERFGATLNTSQRRDIDNFGAALDKLSVAAQGAGEQLRASFAGAGEAIALSLADATGAVTNFLKRQNEFNSYAAEFAKLRSAWAEVSSGPITDAAFQALQAGQTAEEVLARVAGRLQDIKDVAAIEPDDSSLAAVQFYEEISKAAEKAAAFGQDGFSLVRAYEKSLIDVAAAAEDGGLSQEQFKRAVELATDSFDDAIAKLKEESGAQDDAAKTARKAADERIAAIEKVAEAAIRADEQRADAFIRTQKVIERDPAAFAEDNAETLLAITRQIDEAETSIVQARADGDVAAERAALKRLAILDQAQKAAQEAVDFGFTIGDANDSANKARDDLEDAFASAFKNTQAFFPVATLVEEYRAQFAELEEDLFDRKIINPEQFEQAADVLREGFNDAVRDAEAIAKLQEDIAEVRRENLQELSRPSAQALRIDDIRTPSGFAEFVRLATGREDPAIAESRRQNDRIVRAIEKLGGMVEMI